MYPYIPLWKRGARGDFLSIILKSPFIPLCQRGIKTPITEGLQKIFREGFLFLCPGGGSSGNSDSDGFSRSCSVFFIPA